MIDRSDVQGLVLAGGDSTRFERGDKALATLDGRPLVAHVVDAVAGATTAPPLLAVANRDQGERLRATLTDATVRTVDDVDARAGPLAGLLAGATRTDRPWLFVCACDMPLLTGAGIDAVRTVTTSESDAVVPVVDGHAQPLHALYRTDSLERARRRVGPSAGLHALLERLETVVSTTPADLDVPLERAVTNVNTRRELEAVRERAGRRHVS